MLFSIKQVGPNPDPASRDGLISTEALKLALPVPVKFMLRRLLWAVSGQILAVFFQICFGIVCDGHQPRTGPDPGPVVYVPGVSFFQAVSTSP